MKKFIKKLFSDRFLADFCYVLSYLSLFLLALGVFLEDVSFPRLLFFATASILCFLWSDWYSSKSQEASK